MLGDLRELCDHIGGRPTGSPASERAIDWGGAKFKAIGVDAVATEPFTVPNRWAAVSAEAGVWRPWSSHSAWRPRPAPRPHRAPQKHRWWTPARGRRNPSRSWAPARAAPSRWSRTPR